jgi:hypothetical protein
MGMDVFGKKPTSEKGEYFRASVWEWRPIHELICELCSDLVDEATLSAMQWNGGAGPSAPDTCIAMAKRFEPWLARFQGETYVLRKQIVENTPESMAMGLLTQIPDVKIVSPSYYSVERETLVEWMDFLTCCGGFEVH